MKPLTTLACLLMAAAPASASFDLATPKAPLAAKKPKDVTVHEDKRIDDYFWLRQKGDPEVVNYLEQENAYTEAVLAPRFDCQGDIIKCQARIPEYVCAEVRRKHAIERIPDSHGGMALVHAIGIQPETGRLYGAADAGADGMALLVE